MADRLSDPQKRTLIAMGEQQLVGWQRAGRVTRSIVVLNVLAGLGLIEMRYVHPGRRWEVMLTDAGRAMLHGLKAPEDDQGDEERYGRAR